MDEFIAFAREMERLLRHKYVSHLRHSFQPEKHRLRALFDEAAGADAVLNRGEMLALASVLFDHLRGADAAAWRQEIVAAVQEAFEGFAKRGAIKPKPNGGRRASVKRERYNRNQASLSLFGSGFARGLCLDG